MHLHHSAFYELLPWFVSKKQIFQYRANYYELK